MAINHVIGGTNNNITTTIAIITGLVENEPTTEMNL